MPADLLTLGVGKAMHERAGGRRLCTTACATAMRPGPPACSSRAAVRLRAACCPPASHLARMVMHSRSAPMRSRMSVLARVRYCGGGGRGAVLAATIRHKCSPRICVQCTQVRTWHRSSEDPQCVPVPGPLTGMAARRAPDDSNRASSCRSGARSPAGSGCLESADAVEL